MKRIKESILYSKTNTDFLVRASAIQFNMHLVTEGLGFRKRKFLDIIFYIANRVNSTSSNINTISTEVAFVSKKQIQQLNAKYRCINEPTDVLSFNNNGTDSFDSLVLCLDKIQTYNPDTHLSIAMYKTFIHGILHLQGYDHQTNQDTKLMQQKEAEIYQSSCDFLGMKSLWHAM